MLGRAGLGADGHVIADEGAVGRAGGDGLAHALGIGGVGLIRDVKRACHNGLVLQNKLLIVRREDALEPVSYTHLPVQGNSTA